MKKVLRDAQRIVIKIGTSTLTHDTGMINFRRFEKLVKVISDIRNSGREVIIVSSGAMAVGRGKLGIRKKPKDIPTNQATAAIGQGELMRLYDSYFSTYFHVAGQVLITKDIIEEPHRLENVTNTFHRLLELDCIPIVNENDTVSVEEIVIGDNDKLSAFVATICEADALIILTDINGLYDADPRENPDAQLISCVPHITKEIYDVASGAGSDRGTGGMYTKIEAATIATEAGIPVAIVNGADPAILYDVLEGNDVGTLFSATGEDGCLGTNTH